MVDGGEGNQNQDSSEINYSQNDPLEEIGYPAQPVEIIPFYKCSLCLLLLQKKVIFYKINF